MPTRAKKKVARKPARAAHRSGPHKVARKPVMFPAPWDAVCARLAARADRPKLHFLLGLVAAEADRQQLPHPDLPAARVRP